MDADKMLISASGFTFSPTRKRTGWHCARICGVSGIVKPSRSGGFWWGLYGKNGKQIDWGLADTAIDAADDCARAGLRYGERTIAAG